MSIKKAAAVTVVAAVAVGLISCGGSKTAAAPSPAPAYSGAQAAPTTNAQAASANRGVKLEKEECVEKSMETDWPPRESGNGVADDEAFAINLALLDARSKLTQQLEVLTNGAADKFNQMYKGKDGAASSYVKASQLQSAYFEKLLGNTRPICQNIYVKENGEFNVYVTVEADDGVASRIHKQLTEDNEENIDFKEHVFKEEMKDMRRVYLQNKNQ